MAEVDKTGLDILCTRPGDVYLPPKDGGLSWCISKDGTVVVCDSKTDTCTSLHVNDKAPTVEGAMTFRLLKLVKDLNDRVSRLESKLSGQGKKSR